MGPKMGMGPPKVFASGARARPGPKPAKKNQKNRLFGKIGTPEKNDIFGDFCPSVPMSIFFEKRNPAKPAKIQVSC